MIHKKKTWPSKFEEVLLGKKQFEARLANENYQVGDTIILEEWNPETKTYTGRTITKKITYVLKTKEMPQYWPKEEVEKYGLAILSLK